MAIPMLTHILQLSVILVLSISCAASADPENFVHCLLNNSQSSHPIAPAIYSPNNTSYSSVLESYIRNLRFNTSTTRKPFLILTALHESRVQISVVCAQIHNLHMRIRSGGHDYEGSSYVAEVPFFILDMFNLQSIHVDTKSETAWVQAGATLGEVYYRKEIAIVKLPRVQLNVKWHTPSNQLKLKFDEAFEGRVFPVEWGL